MWRESRCVEASEAQASDLLRARRRSTTREAIAGTRVLKKGVQRNDSGQWTAARVERRLREGRGDGRVSDERDDEDDGGEGPRREARDSLVCQQQIPRIGNYIIFYRRHPPYPPIFSSNY